MGETRKYIFNAPGHHKFRLKREGDEEFTEYAGGSELELDEDLHGHIGEPRLVPADAAEGFLGIPGPVQQFDPNPDVARVHAIENQPVGPGYAGREPQGEFETREGEPETGDNTNVGEGDERGQDQSQ